MQICLSIFNPAFAKLYWVKITFHSNKAIFVCNIFFKSKRENNFSHELPSIIVKKVYKLVLTCINHQMNPKDEIWADMNR